MEHNTKTIVKIYIWLLAGILLCAAAACMKYSDSLNFEHFLENGDIYTFSQEKVASATSTIAYDSGTGVYTVTTDNAKKALGKVPGKRSWSYLYLQVSNLTAIPSDWTLVFYDAQKNKLAEQTVHIVAGDNMIPIAYGEPFSRINLVIKNQTGLMFSLTQVQLRDSAAFLDKAELVHTGASYFVVYLLLSVPVWLIKRLGTANLVELLQYAFQLFGDYFGRRLGQRHSEKGKNRIRTFLFFFLFVFMTAWNVSGLYAQKETYKYGILGCFVLLLLIGFISWERPLRYVSWNGILPKVWLALWLMVCISDFATSKFYKFTGYVFFFGVGFLFFVWNNMEKPRLMLKSMMRGLEWTLPAATLYCMLFRQKKIGVLYNGPFLERESMALYAVAVLIALLAELYELLLNQEVQKVKRKILLYGAGASLCIYYLYESYTMICILAGGVVCILFAVMLLKRRKGLLLELLKNVGILFVICSVAVVILVHAGVKNLPVQTGLNLVYETEQWETRLDDTAIWELQQADPAILENVDRTSALSVKAVWSEYLGQLNLMGHTGELYVGNIKTMACNGVLEMIYRYGVFILIPYSLLLLGCLGRAWKEREFFPLAVTVAFGIVLLTQNVEVPFLQPLWIVFYLEMGYWFVSRKEPEEESRHETDRNRTLLQ